MVAFFHFRFFIPIIPGWMDNEIVRESYVWVDFFFILSGFILAHRYNSSFLGTGTWKYSQFLRQRLARIYPLYFVTFVAAVVVAIFKDHKFPDQWGSLLAHIFLVQNWGHPFDPRWNYPAWSLSCEWAAYLVFPILLFFYRRATSWKTTPWIMIGIILGVHYWYCENIVSGNIGDMNTYPLFRCISEFSLGILGYQIRKSWGLGERRKFFDVVQGVLLVLICLSLNQKISDFYFVVLAFFLVLAASFSMGPLTKVLESKPLYFVGTISYSIYLNQILLLMAFDSWVGFSGPGFGQWTAEVYFVFKTAALILLSTLTYYLIEKPGQRLLSRNSRGT